MKNHRIFIRITPKNMACGWTTLKDFKMDMERSRNGKSRNLRGLIKRITKKVERGLG